MLHLKEKLGPINWQMPNTKQFNPDDFEAFLKLLPAEVDGQRLRHVVEVRHPSFAQPAFIALLRTYGVAAVLADHATYPALHDPTAPFVYARLQRASEQEQAGYAADALGNGRRVRAPGRPARSRRTCRVSRQREPRSPASRDVFIYFINGFKPKAPAAALALIERLSA